MFARIMAITLLLGVAGCKKSAEPPASIETPSAVTPETPAVPVAENEGSSANETEAPRNPFDEEPPNLEADSSVPIETEIAPEEEAEPAVEQKIPEGFPLTVSKEAKVKEGTRLTLSDGRKGYLVRFSVSGSVTQVASSYEEQLKSRGLTVIRNDYLTPEGGRITLDASSDKVSVLADFDQNTEKEKTNVMIIWKSLAK